jgi:threonine aldolase
VWTKQQLLDVCSAAKSRGLATHMDGARLFNASIATSTPVDELAGPFDSVWIDLSKGLGCPVGAVLAGSSDFIERALRYKHAFGGAMRQAGIIAAAGVYALKHNVERIAEDHANARLLAAGLADIANVRLLFPVDTNIVFFNVDGLATDELCQRMKRRGVRFSAVGAGVRAVTHLDVSESDVQRAVELVRDELR